MNDFYLGAIALGIAAAVHLFAAKYAEDEVQHRRLTAIGRAVTVLALALLLIIAGNVVRGFGNAFGGENVESSPTATTVTYDFDLLDGECHGVRTDPDCITP